MPLQRDATTGKLLRHANGKLMRECCCCSSECPCYCPGEPEHDPYYAVVPNFQGSCDCSVGVGACSGMVYGRSGSTYPMAFFCEGDGCGGGVACEWKYSDTYLLLRLWYDLGVEKWKMSLDGFIWHCWGGAGPSCPPGACDGYGSFAGTATVDSFDCDTGALFSFSGPASVLCIYEGTEYGSCPIPNISFDVSVHS